MSSSTPYNIYSYNNTITTEFCKVSNSGIINFMINPTKVEAISDHNDDRSNGPGARTIELEGLDNQYNLVKETLTLNGTTPSSQSSNLFFRIFSVKVITCGTYGGTNIGDIYIKKVGNAEIIIKIEDGLGRSCSSLFSVPVDHVFNIKGIKINLDGVKSASVRLYKRENIDNAYNDMSPKQMVWGNGDIQGDYYCNFESEIVIPEKTDIWCEAKCLKYDVAAYIDIDYDGRLLKEPHHAGDHMVVSNYDQIVDEYFLSKSKDTLNLLSYYSDRFSRLRVSEPFTLFDSKQVHSKNNLFWDESLVSGTGITGIHSIDTSDTTIVSTTNTEGRFIRQTYRCFNYQPGKSFLILNSAVLAVDNPTATGGVRRIGYYNDNNGLFFEQNENGLAVVLRTKTSGSPVDTYYYQSEWNIDKMDGTGSSGLTLDVTKTNIFIINFQWLGVGEIVFLVNIDGHNHCIHSIKNANNKDVVYMTNPNLPLRIEMITTSSTPSISMRHICNNIISEGGFDDTALVLAYENGPISCENTSTIYPLIMIRLKTSHIGDIVNILNERILMTSTTDSAKIKLIFNPTLSSTPSFSPYDNSCIEVANGDGTITATGGSCVYNNYISSGNFSNGDGISVIEKIKTNLVLGQAIDGTRDIIALCLEPITGSCDVYSTLTWAEFNT